MGHTQNLRTATQRIGALINDLLRLSRINQSELGYVRVNLSALSKTIIDKLRRENPNREVTCTIQPHLAVYADEPLMLVMLENLLHNAWKFTAQTAMPRIEVGAEQRDEGRVFFVHDNGAGFDMAHVNKIFRPFQRLHHETAFPGTGIGLATVRRIANRHGGRVWAQGAVGQGATFFFTIRNERHRSDIGESYRLTLI